VGFYYHGPKTGSIKTSFPRPPIGGITPSGGAAPWVIFVHGGINVNRFKRYVGVGAFLLVVEAILAIQVMPPGFDGWKPVTVSSGETVWTLGEISCPNADPRDVVDAIVARNHLDGTNEIQLGDVLWVPTQSVSAWQRLAI